MDNTTKSLNSIFGVSSDIEAEVEEVREVTPTAVIASDDVTQDYVFARDNLYKIIESSTKALADLAALSKATEHPRAYEVMTSLTETIIRANESLLELHNKKNKIKQTEYKEGGAHSAKSGEGETYYEMTTTELQRLIRGESGSSHANV